MQTKRIAVTRRAAPQTLGAGLAATPVLDALGCGSSVAPALDGAGADGGMWADGAVGTDGAASGAWATGGTAAMTGRDAYPDPFESGGGTSCTVTCEATIGPCHAESPERSDVSEGWDGLPVRLALRVVDEACLPVANAIVEIWHTNHAGVYSGATGSICNEAEEDRAAGYFRGYLRTDTDGRVDFDTVFPGWYRGRAVHIHFRVLMGVYDPVDDAAASVVSQLFFDDALVEEIFASEPVYRDYGQPDTTNATDGIIRGETMLAPYVLDVARMSDGAMQASKTIVLRVASAACTIGG